MVSNSFPALFFRPALSVFFRLRFRQFFLRIPIQRRKLQIPFSGFDSMRSPSRTHINRHLDPVFCGLEQLRHATSAQRIWKTVSAFWDALSENGMRVNQKRSIGKLVTPDV
jgi:hypothetical protein